MIKLPLALTAGGQRPLPARRPPVRDEDAAMADKLAEAIQVTYQLYPMRHD